jgi:hypothetical protein
MQPTIPQLRRAYAITIFLILLLCYGYFMPKWADWNANSRADLVYAVVDEGVLNIDAYHENTGDKACFPGPYHLEEDRCEGHYYTDKSLGPSLVAVPFYAVFKLIAQIPPVQNFIENGKLPGNFAETLNPEGRGALSSSIYQGMALTFMTFFAISVPSAILGTVVFLFASHFTPRLIHAAVLALAYGLATIAFPYSNTLVQHQLAAFGAFVGFYLIWRVIYQTASVRWLWLAGVLFGLATITEYPIVPVLGVIFLWAAYVYPKRLALWRVVAGAIPIGLIFIAYNYAAFQTVLPVGYEYSTLWQDEHNAGFLSFTTPSLERLYGLTFSPAKGLFLISPFLLLAFPGLVLMWRQHKNQRSMTIALVLAIAGQFAIYSASIMWWGGHTIGPRYLVPILPFLALPVIAAFDALLKRGWGIALTAGLLAWSVIMVWVQTIGGQSWPPTDVFLLTVDLMNRTNIFLDYSLPLVLAGDIARNYGGILLGLDGLAGLLPLLAGVVMIGALVPTLLLRADARPRGAEVASRAA